MGNPITEKQLLKMEAGRKRFLESGAKRAGNPDEAFASAIAKHGLKAKLTMRKAIHAKCYDCVGKTDIKTMIGECAIELCSLHHYRPYQKGDNKGDEGINKGDNKEGE